jgi:hypothetical protein
MFTGFLACLSPEHPPNALVAGSLRPPRPAAPELDPAQSGVDREQVAPRRGGGGVGRSGRLLAAACDAEREAARGVRDEAGARRGTRNR